MSQGRLDVRFESVRLCVPAWGIRRNKKEILRCVSGEFRGGELTAIVGQSGCGKTSLLKVLSSYTTRNVSGTITNRREIRARSKFIMQNYTLHHFITVREAMNFAANFKLPGMSETCKNGKIATVLDSLGLTSRSEVYSGDLSGGEQKRLSIALELVDDPSILFMDEPTTGLDSTSATMCIRMLNKLAQEGKTIICTIHTPSALHFEMVDHLYALADGCCIYQGCSKNLVPFLNELDLICPETYNPADFLLEIANGEYGPQNDRLIMRIQNGGCSLRNETTPRTHQKKVQNCLESIPESTPIFMTQLRHLLYRNYLIGKRDTTLTLMRLTIHLVIAIFIGIMYSGTGDKADNIIDIYRFLFFNIFILMFTAFSSLQTVFPLHLPITKREHFNGWYSTSAYYLGLTISDIPIIVTTNFIYIVITYFWTCQPFEPYRFIAYYCVILFVSIAAQGLGLLAGSILNVKFTLILGSFFICPFVLFSGFFISMKDASYVWHWIFQVSFIKHALDGSLQAIFGGDRPKMHCDAGYCHYRWPHKFLESLGISDSIQNCMTKLIVFALISRTIAFFIMWVRLKR